MTVKNDVIRILEENRGEAVSGEALAEGLGVSRTAVWKAVAALKSEGYPIDGATRRGYVLDDSSSVLSSEQLRAQLADHSPEIAKMVGDISVYNSIDSTNAEAKRRVAAASSPEKLPHGSVIIADSQLHGRGRRGRSFYSPLGDSTYMSFILKPDASIENSLFVTIMAAVAVCRTIEAVAGQIPQIKWVNDIFIGQKKVCGILTEAVSDVESSTIESIILGIGTNINVEQFEFPDDIRNVAGSVELPPGKRGYFVVVLIREIFSLYAELSKGSKCIIEEYRQRSMMEDRFVTVIKASETRQAIAKSISDDGGLLVEYEDGTKENLRSGEVSIKLK